MNALQLATLTPLSLLSNFTKSNYTTIMCTFIDLKIIPITLFLTNNDNYKSVYSNTVSSSHYLNMKQERGQQPLGYDYKPGDKSCERGLRRF